MGFMPFNFFLLFFEEIVCSFFYAAD